MYRIYQVEYGDTIDNIAEKTGTTPNNIKNINGINDNNDLIVGSLIIVPKSENQLFEKYMVKTGDSIYSISKMYDVDPNTLLLLNGLNKTDYKKNVVVYVTKERHTIDMILGNLQEDLNNLNAENEKIYVQEDQLIVHKKGLNK